MWELDCEESWMQKNWCFWTVVLEKSLESPLDCKEIQPVHPKGDQSWVSIARTDAEAEAPILWPPHTKSWLIWKDPDAGRDWGQEEKGITEDEVVGWHHQLNEHGFGWTPGVGHWQGGLACCSSWCHKELGMTELLNWTELIVPKAIFEINAIPIKITISFFTELEEIIQKIQIVKTILNKKRHYLRKLYLLHTMTSTIWQSYSI